MKIFLSLRAAWQNINAFIAKNYQRASFDASVAERMKNKKLERVEQDLKTTLVYLVVTAHTRLALTVSEATSTNLIQSLTATYAC